MWNSVSLEQNEEAGMHPIMPEEDRGSIVTIFEALF